MATRVVCRNDDCPDSAGRSSYPPALKLLKETASAWVFECPRCAQEGRISIRAVTKDQIGGTFGAGRRDDGMGPDGGKGPLKYRPGWTPAGR